MSDDPTVEPTGHPDLVALLRGELTNAATLQAAEHLDGCETCRDDLAETAVGHALLSGAGRTLHPAAEPADPALPPPTLPPPPRPATAGRRLVRPLGLVAAAAVLVAGTAALTTWVVGRDQATPPPVAAQRAELQPVEGNGSGEVEMVDDDGSVSMTVRTSDLPRTGKGEYYQVWLFNPDTGKMLSLGILGPGGRGGYEFPDSLLGRYQVVDVSLERDDGDPAHSVTSVLRATYAGTGSAAS